MILHSLIPADSSVDTGDECLEASFYDTLFNRICLDGWVENPQIEDQNYMQEMLKSGKVYMSSISDDGYYYQGNYSTDKYISEVTDDEAVARAEAKYNTEKTKIQNKEDTIDLKMKNLDTEYLLSQQSMIQQNQLFQNLLKNRLSVMMLNIH